MRHTLFPIFLFHWNESHIFYSLLSCLSKDNIQKCLLNICRIARSYNKKWSLNNLRTIQNIFFCRLYTIYFHGNYLACILICNTK